MGDGDVRARLQHRRHRRQVRQRRHLQAAAGKEPLMCGTITTWNKRIEHYIMVDNHTSAGKEMIIPALVLTNKDRRVINRKINPLFKQSSRQMQR